MKARGENDYNCFQLINLINIFSLFLLLHNDRCTSPCKDFRASLQSHGATALSYQQSLSHSDGIYDVPQPCATDKHCVLSTGHIPNRLPLHVCTYEVKTLASQFMWRDWISRSCVSRHSTGITHGMGSHLTGKVLEMFADGDSTSWFPSGTAAAKPAVQNT